MENCRKLVFIISNHIVCWNLFFYFTYSCHFRSQIPSLFLNVFGLWRPEPKTFQEKCRKIGDENNGYKIPASYSPLVSCMTSIMKLTCKITSHIWPFSFSYPYWVLSLERAILCPLAVGGLNLNHCITVLLVSWIELICIFCIC